MQHCTADYIMQNEDWTVDGSFLWNEGNTSVTHVVPQQAAHGDSWQLAAAQGCTSITTHCFRLEDGAKYCTHTVHVR